MNILNPFQVSSMLGRPFADYLNVTMPLGNEDCLRERLVPLLESLGPLEATDDGSFLLYGLLGIGAAGKLSLAKKGVVKLKQRSKVLVVSASGAALESMREKGCFAEYLSILAEFPHRVSMLHATQDYHVRSPSERVLAVEAAGYSGSLALTRKRLLPEHVRSFLQVNPAGEKTGTVYLGNRANADVWAKVYDKQQERLSRGFADPGPVVRVEVAIQSDVGATLRDAMNPESLFFNFAGRTLVEVPAGVSPWEAHGEGFAILPRVDRLPYERLQQLLSFSQDLPKLIEQAVAAYGVKAGDVLAREVQTRCTAFIEAAAVQSSLEGAAAT